MVRGACMGVICAVLATAGCLKENPAHDAEESQSTGATTTMTGTTSTSTSTDESGSATGVDPCAPDVNNAPETADELPLPPGGNTLAFDFGFTGPNDTDWYKYDLGASDAPIGNAYAKVEKVPDAGLCLFPACSGMADLSSVICAIGVGEGDNGNGDPAYCCAGDTIDIEVEVEYACVAGDASVFHELRPPTTLGDDCVLYTLRYSHQSSG